MKEKSKSNNKETETYSSFRLDSKTFTSKKKKITQRTRQSQQQLVISEVSSYLEEEQRLASLNE